MKSNRIFEEFSKVYSKFKLRFYSDIFKKWNNYGASLTIVETVCMEAICALDHPTISGFAKFAGISSPNAAFKINNLRKKGYLKKVQDENDKRKYYLEPTDKYLMFYDMSLRYLEQVTARLDEHFSASDLKILEKVLKAVDEDLTPELDALKG